MAGVSGPCPACGGIIRSPYAAALPAAPVSFIPPSFPSPALDPREAPADPSATRSSIPWRPKNAKAESPDIQVRSMPEYLPGELHVDQLRARPAGGQNSRVRLMLLFSVMGLICLIIYAAKKFPPGVTPNPPSQETATPSPAPAVPATVDGTIPPGKEPPTVAANAGTAAAQPKPKPVNRPSYAKIAAETLDKFLNATTLDQRMPIIQSRLSPAQLAETVLAKPFPAEPLIEQDIQETNNVFDFSDWYYNIDFKRTGGEPNLQMLVIRINGDGSARVLADPFLDSFGGRLAAYATTPTSQPATFQVIASALARCYDDVPNADHKLTLKLLPRENAPEITRAYFGRQSRIAAMLQDNDSGFRYGQARPCKVTLRWNTEEDPARPYLEAITLNELRWNP